MFDWVLNMPLNTITILFSWPFHIKVNDFLSFPTSTCQRLRRIYNPVEHSTMELFREIFFFEKFTQENTCARSHFNKVAGLYPAASLKERTPTQVLSSEFCEILKAPFLQSFSRLLLLLYRKNIFSIK